MTVRLPSRGRLQTGPAALSAGLRYTTPACGQLLLCTSVIPREGLLPANHQRSAPHENYMARRPIRVPCAWWRPGDGVQRPVCRVPGEVTVPGTPLALSLLWRAGRAYHRPNAMEVTQRKLHSVRLERPRQTALVRGRSNQELKLTSGRLRWGRGRGSVAVRRSLTPNALGTEGAEEKTRAPLKPARHK
jgi:hypothetical protein